MMYDIATGSITTKYSFGITPNGVKTNTTDSGTESGRQPASSVRLAHDSGAIPVVLHIQLNELETNRDLVQAERLTACSERWIIKI